MNLRVLDVRTGEVLFQTMLPDAGIGVLSCHHFQWSQGWLLQDSHVWDSAYLWKCARLDNPNALWGKYQMYEKVDEPGDVLRLHAPILARYVARLPSVKQGTYLEMDMLHQHVLRTYDLDDWLGGKATGVEFDDDYVVITGTGAEHVVIFSRETGEVMWTFSGHVCEHGPPTCFRSAFWLTDDRHSFLLREVVEVPAPSWLHIRPPSEKTASVGASSYVWKRIVIERETQTLLILGESILLMIPNYKRMLRGETAPTVYAYLFLREKESQIKDDEGNLDLPQTLQRITLRNQKLAEITASHGRAAVALETLTLFDLHTPTQGRTVSGQMMTVPFAVYEWSNAPREAWPHRPPFDHLRNCEGITMDATSLYCVTSQSIARENVPWNEFPDGYQEAVLENDSTMVTAFHFTDGAVEPTILPKSLVARPMYEPTLDDIKDDDPPIPSASESDDEDSSTDSES